jgi:hypothetical protein
MLGARCCVNIAGSFNPYFWAGPDPKNITDEFIDATVENCRHVIDVVKPTRTNFTIEIEGFTFPTGPDDYLKLIKFKTRGCVVFYRRKKRQKGSPG